MHEVSLITIKFSPAMRRAALEDRKQCTTRSEPKGVVGDKFAIGHKILEITRIEPHPLDYVAETLYKEEGFNSPEEFRDTWCRLHRMNPANYPADAEYWKLGTRYTHFFREVRP